MQIFKAANKSILHAGAAICRAKDGALKFKVRYFAQEQAWHWLPDTLLGLTCCNVLQLWLLLLSCCQFRQLKLGSLVNSTSIVNVTAATFQDCLALCTDNCPFVTYDYDAPARANNCVYASPTAPYVG